MGQAAFAKMRIFFFAWGLFLSMPQLAGALSVDRLSEEEIALVDGIMKKWVPLVDRRKQEGTAPLLTFYDLYAPLTEAEQAFLDRFRALEPSELGGTSRRLPSAEPNTPFVRLDRQVIQRDGRPIVLDTQYLPFWVWQAYERMMAAMEQEIGKRLLVESGYRSEAYQMYLFLFYLPKHDYSIRQTNRHVALPGFSEHGSPRFQAIDFITPEGINGEDHPEQFEELEEYRWLQARAHEFGFHLSYPRGGSWAFEPWHWHWEED
jgi:D-alanyl-D-alanine carboxypeptidase